MTPCTALRIVDELGLGDLTGTGRFRT
ncbi:MULTISPECIES: hypothetical protein [Brucella/Ochrobactrum group]